MKTNLIYDPSNLPMGGDTGRRAKHIKNIKLSNNSRNVGDADVINAISKLLTADYAVEQKAYIEQIERGVNRKITPLLSRKFKVELYKVSENVADVYSTHSAPSTIQASLIIEYVTDVRVDATIYLTNASSATIYAQRFSGDMLLVSEDSHQNTYLENDLALFDYTDILSALRSIVEDMFFRHQQVEIKKDAKKRNIPYPFVLADNDFDFHLYATVIGMENNMNLMSEDRIKLKVDYFREEWTHIKVAVTIYNTTGVRKMLKVSGDVELWGFIE